MINIDTRSYFCYIVAQVSNTKTYETKTRRAYAR